MKIIKIGILINDLKRLRNWEFRIIQELKDDPSIELTVLIRDFTPKEKGNKKKTYNHNIQHNGRHVLASKILNLQFKFEEKLFRNKSTVNKEQIIGYLKDSIAVYLKPELGDEVNSLKKSDIDKVKQLNLDLILKQEFMDVEGELLDVPKFGVWSFHHNDKAISGLRGVGFWENVNKEPSVSVVLTKVSGENNKVIDQTNFNRHFSSVKTNALVNEASVSLLLKNIRQLYELDANPKVLEVNLDDNKSHPDIFSVAKYCFKFYRFMFCRFVEGINYSLFGVRSNCWTLFVGKGNILEANLSDLRPLKLPKDEFWADPFLYEHKGEVYIFFENYSYKANRAKVSCGKLKGDKLIDIVDVLDFDYHLSYPFIFEEDGEIYLMPESNKQQKISVYKCKKFPNEWELYSTAFEGELVADAFFFNDEKKQKWLFVNKRNPNTTFANELFIYKADSLKMEKLEPHKKNPVIIDSTTARNGGSIFSYNNEYYRPSQSNIMGIYGRNINVNKIKKLTIDSYEEETVNVIKPDFYKNLVATHHLHQIQDYFVIDAAYGKK